MNIKSIFFVLISCILVVGLLVIDSQHKKKLEAIKHNQNECYANFKYFMHMYSGELINKDRTPEQVKALQALDKSIDNLIFEH